MAKSKLGEHKSTSFVITDFETGGLDLNICGLTEIGMIAISGDTLKEIGRYQSLIKPYCNISGDDMVYEERAFEITGLNMNKLEKEGKEISEVANEVLEFLKMVYGRNGSKANKPVMIAHNAQMEVKCFQHLMDRTGTSKEFEKVLDGFVDFYGNFQPSYIDTLKIGKLMYGHEKKMVSFALNSVCERAGVDIPDGHRAMNDVIPSTEFIRKAIKLLRSSESSSSSTESQFQSFRQGFKFEY